MWRRVLVRGLIGVGVAMLVCYGALRSYVVYEAHRGARLLEALSHVRIGDSNDSVIALAKRFPEAAELDPPGPNACEFRLSAWWQIQDFNQPVDSMVLALVGRVPGPVRRGVGLRDLAVGGSIVVEHGQVSWVGAGVGVEGRDQLLSAGWILASNSSEGTPSIFRTQPLHVGDRLWHVMTAYITPESPEADKAAAYNISLKCLTSFRGCASLADLAPDAARRVGR